MKKIVFALVILISNISKSQSVSYADLKKFAKQDWNISEDFLVDKFFKIKEIRFMGDDTVKVYDNSIETIYLGLSFKDTSGKYLKDVTYMTQNKAFMLSIFRDVSLTDWMTSDINKEHNEDEHATVYFLKNKDYSIQISMPDKEGDFNLIQIVER